MEVVSNRDNGEDLEDAVIGEWMHEYIWQRDKSTCQICKQATQTEHNPLVVERKDSTLPSRATNLELRHWECHEEYQARTREKDLRLRPDILTATQHSRQKRPKYWTGKRVLALLTLLVVLALLYGCCQFYLWCFRVFWP